MKKIIFSGLLVIFLPLVACSANPISTSTSGNQAVVKPLITGAIPDQDPEKLQRQYTKLSVFLEKELGVPVKYKPVTNYAAAVTGFKVGDLDLVWFGGLTGVQARLQVPGAKAIAQRDVDENFHSVFIANKKAGLKLLQNINELRFDFHCY